MLIYPNMYHQKSDHLIEILTDMTPAERTERDKKFLADIKNTGWTLATNDHLAKLFNKLKDLPDSNEMIVIDSIAGLKNKQRKHL